MGMEKVQIHDPLLKWQTSGVFDHFNSYTNTQLWTSVANGSGASVANNDGDGGILTLTTGATINNESAVKSTRANWTFVANKPLVFQCGFKYTEAATNAAGIVVGFASSWTNILADTTFALPSSLSGALIYKKPTDTYWSAFGSVGTTQYSQLSVSPCQNAGIAQNFMIQMMLNQNSQVEITFWQGPVGISSSAPFYNPMYPSVTSIARQQAIKFFIPYASAAAMQMGVFVKASGSNSEVVSLDYLASEFLSIP